MALKITTTQEAAQLSGVKLGIYGPSGHGKTALIATLPGPVIAVSVEKGLLTLSPANIARMYGVNTPGISYNIRVLEINGFADLGDVYSYITTSEEGKACQSVALDSSSDIAEVCLAEQKRLNKDGRMAWGNTSEKVTEMIRAFRDLPGKNVYFSAKMSRELAADGLVLNQPDMPGKELTKQFPHFFDEVYYLGVSAKTPQAPSYRFLRTQPDNQFYAKSRSGCLDEIEEPNLGKIIEKIRARALV